MSECACGCGQFCANTWVRGHNHRADVPNVRFVYSVPVQRVLPLIEFLYDVYGSNRALARALAVDPRAVGLWRRRRVRRISPGCARRVVEAVKAHETALRDEARRELVRTERARYRR